jgi:3-(methylthio)propanoyl-CoA dehydrogenase
LQAIAADAGESPALAALTGACAEVTEWMLDASIDDRLAGSYAYTQMMAVATSGWLMLRQLRAAVAEQAANGTSPFLDGKVVACRYYLEVMVAEAVSLKNSAMAGSELLYMLDAEGMAA